MDGEHEYVIATEVVVIFSSLKAKLKILEMNLIVIDSKSVNLIVFRNSCIVAVGFR